MCTDLLIYSKMTSVINQLTSTTSHSFLWCRELLRYTLLAVFKCTSIVHCSHYIVQYIFRTYFFYVQKFVPFDHLYLFPPSWALVIKMTVWINCPIKLLSNPKIFYFSIMFFLLFLFVFLIRKCNCIEVLSNNAQYHRDCFL